MGLRYSGVGMVPDALSVIVFRLASGKGAFSRAEGAEGAEDRREERGTGRDAEERWDL